jgi:hypothetical protein
LPDSVYKKEQDGGFVIFCKHTVDYFPKKKAGNYAWPVQQKALLLYSKFCSPIDKMDSKQVNKSFKKF